MFGPPRGAGKTYQLMDIANTISYLLEETVRFVHDVSQLRTGKNVKYYTMVLQFPDKNCRTVSYRKDFNDEFPKKTQNESPMKMITVNYFDKTKADIEATNNKALEILEENHVEFECNIYEQIDECSLVDAATILSSKKDKDWVSLYQ